jgi:hypothetical protein
MFNIRSRVTDESLTLEKDNINDEIRLFNMNYFVVLGVQYSLGGTTALVGGVGYSAGFADVTTGSEDEITISSVNIRLGILF